MNAKVVLVKPPERSAFNFGAFSLGVLAASVRHLADIAIVDATDLPNPAAIAAVCAHRPDLIGVTVMGLQSVKPAVAFIRDLCQGLAAQGAPLTHVPIIAGGHGASMLPAPLLTAGAATVVIGEGELTFQQILAHGLCPAAPGTACLVDNRVVLGPPQPLIRPLDRLPLPARDLMPAPREQIHLMETSRGCPHACSFCEATRFYGRRWRAYSPERVVREVQHLVDECDAWIIHFADDNFAADPKRVLRICELLQGVSLPAFFMASARIDDLIADPALLPAMAAARMLRISVGVETLNPAIAAAVGKPLTLDICRQTFSRMRDLGIFSVASFIVGLPGEDLDLRTRSVELAVAAGPDSAQFLPFLPLPGIPLAAGREGSDPATADVHAAQAYTQAFFDHPIVQHRLQTTVAQGGVVGMLASGVLNNRGKIRLG